MGSLVAELAEKLSAATNSLDFDEQTMFLNTSANTVGIGTNAPASKFDVRGTVQVGVDGTGHNVVFYGDTAGRNMTWQQGNDALEFPDNTKIHIGNSNDMQLYHDATNSYITNAVGVLKIATVTSGIAVTIGHTTSETTIADNLTVTGTLTGTLATAAQGTVTSLGTLTGLTVNGQVVFNENSADVDFRVEGNGNAGAFYVDGGTDNVGIGTQAFGAGAHSTLTALYIGAAGSISTQTADAAGNSIWFGQNAILGTDANFKYLDSNSDEASLLQMTNGYFAFRTAGAGTAGNTATMTTRMTILNDGNVGIGTTAPTAGAKFEVASSDSTTYAGAQGDINGITIRNDDLTNNNYAMISFQGRDDNSSEMFGNFGMI